MIYWLFIVFANLLLSAPSERLEKDILNSLSFAKDPRELSYRSVNQKNLGMLAYHFSGLGVGYTQVIGEKNILWTEVVYNSGSFLFPSSMASSDTVNHFQHDHDYEVYASVGVERLLHITDDRSWGINVGVGVGAAQERVKTKFYSKVCNLFWCGFDPKSATEVVTTDTYVRLLGRLGVSFLKRRVWGVTGNYGFVILPNLRRFPEKPDIIGPDGRVYGLEQMVPIIGYAYFEL